MSFIINTINLFKTNTEAVTVEVVCHPQTSHTDYRISDQATGAILGKMMTSVRNQNPIQWVTIESLDNLTIGLGSRKVQRVGTTLVDCAIAESFERGCSGAVRLQTYGKSHFFYWSLGFRSLCKETNGVLEELDAQYKNGALKISKNELNRLLFKRLTKGFSISMHLSEEALQEWAQRDLSKSLPLKRENL